MIFSLVTNRYIQELDKLTRDRFIEFQYIAAKTPQEAARQLAVDDKLVLLELEYFDREDATCTIKLLRDKNGCTVILLADGYDEDSKAIKAAIKSGVQKENIIYSLDEFFRPDLYALLAPFLISDFDDEEIPTPETFRPTSEQAKEEFIENRTVPLALQFVNKKAVTIAVAGVGRRIGTTTQAMQLLHFALAQGYRACLVEMCSTSMSCYISSVDEDEYELLDEQCYTLQHKYFFKDNSAILKAKKDFDILILDYGEFDKINDIVSFLEKDIKVVVCGVKPTEIEPLENVFKADDGNIQYIFSFVDKEEEKQIRYQMAESAPNTFFASWAPDPLRYYEDNMYWSITGLGEAELPSVSSQKNKFKLFKKNKI